MDTNHTGQELEKPNGESQAARDDVSHAETISRRRFDMHQGASAPAVTKSADGTISIEMDAMNDDSGFYVRWNDLSYTVSSKWLQRLWNPQSKTILNNLNGFFLSGELVALMGPSGEFALHHQRLPGRLAMLTPQIYSPTWNRRGRQDHPPRLSVLEEQGGGERRHPGCWEAQN